jgi:hypothetical protein
MTSAPSVEVNGLITGMPVFGVPLAIASLCKRKHLLDMPGWIAFAMVSCMPCWVVYGLA